MYWIDINLLNDREDLASDFGPAPLQIQDSKAPMAIGLGIGAAAIALVFGAYSVFGFINQNLAAEEQDLEQKIARLQPKLDEIESLESRLANIRAQTDSLARIFNQIKPWSAMLADLRDRVPSTLQIKKITQSAGGGSGGEGGSKASSSLNLTGSALSFGDVNDFVLTLRESNYLSKDGAQTQLKNATRTDSRDGASLVDYTIDTKVNDVPAKDLLGALRQNGASGLVSRIETLKRQGVIQK